MTHTFTAPPSRIDNVAVGKVVETFEPEGLHDLATLSNAWQYQRDHYLKVSPPNTRRFTVIVIGTGLIGSGCAAALGELGYNVKVITYHDSPRRAHSVAAQGGVNSARGKKVDNDSLYNFVKDTVKGGDFRGRETEAFRLGEESVRVIDHMNAIGAPFAREYGGTLATRSFGGVQVSRTYYTRGQTGQQLQIAGAQALQRQVRAGSCELLTRTEMLDIIIKDGHCRGVITRNLVTGEIEAHTGHATVLGTGGYGNVYYASTLAKMSNVTATWRVHQHGAYFASPCFVQFHPTGLPYDSKWQSKTILMSESLRNDGRIWVPKDTGETREANDVPEEDRDYYMERKYPAFGNLAPRDVTSRNAKEQIDAGRGVGPLKNSVYLDFRDAIARLGKDVIWSRYSNLFEMYEHATGEDPLKVPMRIAPCVHFSMGGIWTDYNCMTSIPGLFAGGECSWAYHGANRLGANSLLSASVDGWFTLPFSIPNYLAQHLGEPVLPLDDPVVVEALDRVRTRINALMNINGSHGPEYFHRKLGEILFEGCGVERNEAGLRKAIAEIVELRKEFWRDLRITGTDRELNQVLERAGRVADYLEMAELMCIDALDRDESCGAHFRSEHISPDGEAQRDDEHWAFASVWESKADDASTFGGTRNYVRHMEPLTFHVIELQTRNYK